MRPPTLLAALLLVAAPFAQAEPVRYRIDPEHTYPSLAFPHLGISVWRGKFDRSSGQITLDREARKGHVEVEVDPASINFGLAAMDDKARSEDFFNVAKYPRASYRGDIVFDGDRPVAVDGRITLLAVTRPLKLTIRSLKCIPHPITREVLCGADVGGELNWSEYGMKWSSFGQGEAGRVQLDIQVEASPLK